MWTLMVVSLEPLALLHTIVSRLVSGPGTLVAVQFRPYTEPATGDPRSSILNKGRGGAVGGIILLS